jgi:purine-binding chemotaxis protein CheW
MADDIPVLIVARAGRRCAIAIGNVVEVMRRLPIEAVDGAPPYVLGVSIIRGAPTPVVDLGFLIDAGDGDRPAARLVTLRVAERTVALAVDEVVGVRRIRASDHLPPLLDGASDVVRSIETADAGLLWVLQSAMMIPDDAWRVVEQAR